MARCTAADERAAGCAGEVLTEFSGPQEMKNFALAVGIPACVQKHRTRTAGPDAGNRVAAAKLGTGLVKLPDALATLSLDETAWIGARPDGRTWVFLPTWRGRCRNVAGFLWSSGAFEPGDFSKDDGGRTMWIVGFTATDACSKGTEPEPWTSEHEPFTVLERPHDQWVFIQWGWD